MVEYKGKEEDVYIPPTDFDKTFEELGIHSGGQVTLIEMKARKGIVDESSEDDDEGGEDDMDDMEAELEGEAEGEGQDDKPADGDVAAGASSSRQQEPQEDSAAKEGGAAELSSPTAGNVAAVETMPFGL